MAHQAQRDFLRYTKMMFPEAFNHGPRTLDIGSRDINGNNRWVLSYRAEYIGLDLSEGPNVDVVCHAADYPAAGWDLRPFDLILCTEALEHDARWQDTIRAAATMLRPGGLLVITCAGPGRPEHGTHGENPQDSPETLDYYQNLSPHDIKQVVVQTDLAVVFRGFMGRPICDTYFIARKPEA